MKYLRVCLTTSFAILCPIHQDIAQKWRETLHCSADYLLGLVDEPCATGWGPCRKSTVGCWIPGSTTPDHPCECYVMLDVSDTDMEKSTHRIKAYWTGGLSATNRRLTQKIPSFPVLAWLEIPEWKGGNAMPKPSAFMVRLQENQRHNMHLQPVYHPTV